MTLQRLSVEQLALYRVAEFCRRESESWAAIHRAAGKPVTAAGYEANAAEWVRRREAACEAAP